MAGTPKSSVTFKDFTNHARTGTVSKAKFVTSSLDPRQIRHQVPAAAPPRAWFRGAMGRTHLRQRNWNVHPTRAQLLQPRSVSERASRQRHREGFLSSRRYQASPTSHREPGAWRRMSLEGFRQAARPPRPKPASRSASETAEAALRMAADRAASRCSVLLGAMPSQQRGFALPPRKEFHVRVRNRRVNRQLPRLRFFAPVPVPSMASLQASADERDVAQRSPPAEPQQAVEFLQRPRRASLAPGSGTLRRGPGPRSTPSSALRPVSPSSPSETRSRSGSCSTPGMRGHGVPRGAVPSRVTGVPVPDLCWTCSAAALLLLHREPYDVIAGVHRVAVQVLFQAACAAARRRRAGGGPAPESHFPCLAMVRGHRDDSSSLAFVLEHAALLRRCLDPQVPPSPAASASPCPVLACRGVAVPVNIIRFSVATRLQRPKELRAKGLLWSVRARRTSKPNPGDALPDREACRWPVRAAFVILPGVLPGTPDGEDFRDDVLTGPQAGTQAEALAMAPLLMGRAISAMLMCRRGRLLGVLWRTGWTLPAPARRRRYAEGADNRWREGERRGDGRHCCRLYSACLSPRKLPDRGARLCPG